MNHYIGKYEFNKILFQNNFFTIYEGSRKSDNLALLFKTVESAFTVADQIKTLEKECKTVGEVDSPYISNILKIRDLTISEFLVLAIKLTMGIKDIHYQGIILKNLNLDSIIWNDKTQKCQIIDFSLASDRVLENAQLDFYLLKQTELGRINRKKFEVTAKFFDWGCLPKVDLLKEKYLFLSTNKPEEMQCTMAGNFSMSDSSPVNLSNLDLNSILETSYAN